MNVGLGWAVWGYLATPSAPGVGTHGPFPLPWEAHGNVCRGLISDQPLRAIGEDAEAQRQPVSWPSVWGLCRTLSGT